MIRLNRTTEYGLVALRHMSRKLAADPSGVTSAREIADCYGFPFEITAKTLQRLKDTGIIQSAQGARGGYRLHRVLNDITLADFLGSMEGGNGVVACVMSSPETAAESDSCEYQTKCELKILMGALNSRVWKFLQGIKLAEITDALHPIPGIPVSFAMTGEHRAGLGERRAGLSEEP